MRRTISIGGKDCEFKTSAAIPRMYRLLFRRDLFNDLTYIQKNIEKQQKKIKEAKERAKAHGRELKDNQVESNLPLDTLTIFENIAFLMHKHGDPTQPKEIGEWLDQFDTFDIYQIFPEILQMWEEENATLSTPKKSEGE